MIAPSPKGPSGPKSTTKPVFLDGLFQDTVVPTFIQNGMFAFEFGILGVTEASEAFRLISTVHGVEPDPQVFWALQIASGCGSEQR